MTKLYHATVVAAFLGIVTSASAQNFLKNPGFETWNGKLPASWKTDTISASKSTVVHGGAAALRITHSSFLGVPFMGGASQDSLPVTGTTFSLKGWYQFYPDTGDAIEIIVLLRGLSGGTRQNVGAGGIEFYAKKTVYTAFAIPVYVAQNSTPDTASVSILTFPDTVSGNFHLGTYALFDDFVLDNTVTDVKNNAFAKPSDYSLSQNYPNPFNPSTEIEFAIPKGLHVTLKVYDIMGQEIETLVDEQLPQGRYKKSFDASRLSSGMYLYKIQAGNYVEVKKMTLVK